ncbi:hypothetical protein OSB04_022288 [Centaurea solstitialis]|uniref:CobW/HypB/UreG nucleotide-binding domain-containing protein n=1 Tax=Centaurea solstitialis TaxID=347529 RepID=A0AA38T7V1_9ASTR|nr:hypothetical protein OSB04_022288 [Centaurea solstitialis]
MATMLRRLLSPKAIGNLHQSLQHNRFTYPSSTNPLPPNSSSEAFIPLSICSAASYDDASVAAALNLDDRVPATVITGFLGSGKVEKLESDDFILLGWQTTLLNHILTAQHGKRIAVIENEFGEVDIDGSLVASHASANEDIVTVSNGCLCCTSHGELVTTLLELVKKKRDKFDHIVIETTGLAKPGPVIETFCTDEQISRYVKLDGVVTLVDSKHAMQHLNEVKPRFVVNEAVEQVAYADRIILNKIDLVSEADLEDLTKKIQLTKPMSRMLMIIDDIIIDSEVPSDASHCENHNHEHGHECHEGYHHHDHKHDSAVTSVSIVSEGTLDLDEAGEEKGDDLYRMKGVLSVNDSETRYVFQGVHSTLDGCPGKPWGTDEKRINKLVFIGRNLDESR